MILLIGSQKGGVGKSTLCTNLAFFLAKKGRSLILVDGDSQESLSRWASDREESEISPQISCIKKNGRLKATLMDLSQKYEYVICDTAGRDSVELRTALVVSDAIVSPFRPTQTDLDTLCHLENLVEEVKDFNEKLKAFAVLSMVNRSKGKKEEIFARDLFERSNFKLMESFIGDRKAYQKAMGTGESVLELDDKKAKDEILKLCEEVFNV
ncbi:hypothetical protein AB834_00145 [PVC group bacterium (ex Bugula neritina AB1)]|nr:hypothetical protein AB834_00145 [PVC group bacterium (ex Bugula neritina AB1)]